MTVLPIVSVYMTIVECIHVGENLYRPSFNFVQPCIVVANKFRFALTCYLYS